MSARAYPAFVQARLDHLTHRHSAAEAQPSGLAVLLTVDSPGHRLMAAVPGRAALRMELSFQGRPQLRTPPPVVLAAAQRSERVATALELARRGALAVVGATRGETDDAELAVAARLWSLSDLSSHGALLVRPLTWAAGGATAAAAGRAQLRVLVRMVARSPAAVTLQPAALHLGEVTLPSMTQVTVHTEQTSLWQGVHVGGRVDKRCRAHVLCCAGRCHCR